MAFSKEARATTNFSKSARPISNATGRYGFGLFGYARYGTASGFSKSARPVTAFTKSSLP